MIATPLRQLPCGILLIAFRCWRGFADEPSEYFVDSAGSVHERLVSRPFLLRILIDAKVQQPEVAVWWRRHVRSILFRPRVRYLLPEFAHE